MNQKPAGSPGYEVRDTSFRAVFLWTVALVVVLVFSLAFSWVVDRYLARPAAPTAPISPLAELHRLPPEPRLEVDERANLRVVRAGEEERLNSYGWVDAQARIVHLPIDRAMALIAERGLPARSQEKAR
jgi:hypothetical protein